MDLTLDELAVGEAVGRGEKRGAATALAASERLGRGGDEAHVPVVALTVDLALLRAREVLHEVGERGPDRGVHVHVVPIGDHVFVDVVGFEAFASIVFVRKGFMVNMILFFI